MARKPKSEDGDKAPNVSPELMAEAVAATVVLNSEQARLANKFKVHWQQYEKLGVSRPRVTATVKRIGMSAEEIKAENREQLRYDIAAGLITLADAQWAQNVKQGDIEFAQPEHGSDGDTTLAHALAYRGGYECGKDGGPVEQCSFSPTLESDRYVAWRDGWADGVEDRVAAKPETAKERPASTRRSRKKPGDDPIGETAGSA